jgi:segregation and condensation protein B
MPTNQQIKSIIESLLFVSEKPLLLEQIKEVLEGADTVEIRALINELKSEYEQRDSGVNIVEIAGGFQMCTSGSSAPYLKKFYKIKHAERLTGATLETLAIIAYKQPVTRLDIESLRGVNVDGVMRNLLDKGLVRIAGRKNSPGRPFVYGTTRQFLEYFGLKSLDELPKIEEFVKVADQKEKELIEEKKEEENEPEKTTQENR